MHPFSLPTYLHTVCAQLVETLPIVHKALGPQPTVGYCGKIPSSVSAKHKVQLLKRLDTTGTHDIKPDARETLDSSVVTS